MSPQPQNSSGSPHTCDGYAAFEDNLVELGPAVHHTRQSWEQAHELPKDLNVLHTCLFRRSRAHSRRVMAPLHEQPFLRALVSRIGDVSVRTVPWIIL